MRIAIDVSQVIFGTGVAAYTRHLVTELLKIKTNDEFFLFASSFRRRREINQWISRLPEVEYRTVIFPPSALQVLWNSLHLLPIETFTGPFDVLHTSDWVEPPSKYPKVTTIHDLAMFIDPTFTDHKTSQVHKKRLFWVAKESTKIITVSQATKQDIIKYLEISPEKIEVIPEASTIPPFTESSIELAKPRLRYFGITKPFILIPGSGHPRKNLKRAIKAFENTNLDYQLVIVGRPSEGEKEITHNSDVIFTGFVSQADYSLLLYQSRLVLYPSLYEGFGLPILDAFAAQTPVVTSNISSMPEVASDATVLVDPQSVDSIKLGILDALNNKNTLIQKGKKRLKDYSWEKTALQTLKLYQSIGKK